MGCIKGPNGRSPIVRLKNQTLERESRKRFLGKDENVMKEFSKTRH